MKCTPSGIELRDHRRRIVGENTIGAIFEQGGGRCRAVDRIGEQPMAGRVDLLDQTGRRRGSRAVQARTAQIRKQFPPVRGWHIGDQTTPPMRRRVSRHRQGLDTGRR